MTCYLLASDWFINNEIEWDLARSAQQVLFQGYCGVLIQPWILFSITCFVNPRVTNPIQSNSIQSNPVQSIFYNMALEELEEVSIWLHQPLQLRKLRLFSFLAHVEGLAAHRSGQN